MQSYIYAHSPNGGSVRKLLIYRNPQYTGQLIVNIFQKHVYNMQLLCFLVCRAKNAILLTHVLNFNRKNYGQTERQQIKAI